MTAQEVISLAFTRNLSTSHIKTSDIAVAQKMYVDAYITDAPTTGTGALYVDYIKPVIAYGVAVNTFERIASEITDRGIVDQSPEGARIIDVAGRSKLRNEFQLMLDNLIDMMVEEADEAGLTVMEYDTSQIQFTGTERIGTL